MFGELLLYYRYFVVGFRRERWSGRVRARGMEMRLGNFYCIVGVWWLAMDERGGWKGAVRGGWGCVWGILPDFVYSLWLIEGGELAWKGSDLWDCRCVAVTSLDFSYLVFLS